MSIIRGQSIIFMSATVIPIKLVVVGDGAVGKTCLLISYAQNKFPIQYVPTIFDNYTATVKIDGHLVNLSLWDTAGQEEYQRLRPLAYPNCDVFLIVFSVVDPSSWINAYKKWYPELCIAVGERVPKIFVGNKIDQRQEWASIYKDPKNAPINSDAAKKLVEQNFKGCKYMECSALTQQGLKAVFDEAMRQVIQNRVKGSLIKPTHEQKPGWCQLI